MEFYVKKEWYGGMDTLTEDLLPDCDGCGRREPAEKLWLIDGIKATRQSVMISGFTAWDLKPQRNRLLNTSRMQGQKDFGRKPGRREPAFDGKEI